MSDAAYFSAFFEPQFETHTRHLRSIDRKRKNAKKQKKEIIKKKKELEGKFYYILDKTLLEIQY